MGPKPRRCSALWAPSLPSSSATRPGCSRRYRSVRARHLSLTRSSSAATCVHASRHICVDSRNFGLAVSVDGEGAGGARHEAGAAAAVHRRRRGVLRHQRGGVLGVRVGGVGVPPQRARRPEVGRRPHQRHRLPAEHCLPTRTHASFFNFTCAAGHTAGNIDDVR